ncbi:MAG: aminoacyl-tRNA hydrolase [Nitrospirota bacterium]
MKAIIGLGNPGTKYKETRHNIGWMAVDILASRHSISIKKNSRRYISGKGTIRGEDVIIVKPQIYMNNSGMAVKELSVKMKLEAGDIIVIHDDIDMELGKIRTKKNGGHGGHNGIRSIIEELGKGDFVRIKIGIGRKKGISPADFVLSPFEREELPFVDEAIEKAMDKVVELL